MGNIDSIGEYGCACGDYESENLIASVSCRKSGGSPECSIGVSHLLTYRTKTPEGLKELGPLVDRLWGYGADCTVLVNDEQLSLPPPVTSQ